MTRLGPMRHPRQWQLLAKLRRRRHSRLPPAAPAPAPAPLTRPLLCLPLLVAIRPVPEGFTVRTEGKVSILQSGNEVFFNPAQVINRDMSLSGGVAGM